MDELLDDSPDHLRPGETLRRAEEYEDKCPYPIAVSSHGRAHIYYKDGWRLVKQETKDNLEYDEFALLPQLGWVPLYSLLLFSYGEKKAIEILGEFEPSQLDLTFDAESIRDEYDRVRESFPAWVANAAVGAFENGKIPDEPNGQFLWLPHGKNPFEYYDEHTPEIEVYSDSFEEHEFVRRGLEKFAESDGHCQPIDSPMVQAAWQSLGLFTLQQDDSFVRGHLEWIFKKALEQE